MGIAQFCSLNLNDTKNTQRIQVSLSTFFPFTKNTKIEFVLLPDIVVSVVSLSTNAYISASLQLRIVYIYGRFVLWMQNENKFFKLENREPHALVE